MSCYGTVSQYIQVGVVVALVICGLMEVSVPTYGRTLSPAITRRGIENPFFCVSLVHFERVSTICYHFV